MAAAATDRGGPAAQLPEAALANSRAHLFGSATQAADYAQFRPSYPDSLYESIYEFAGPSQLGVALDIATGSGQAAVQIAKRYDRVIAQDASAAQLQESAKVDQNAMTLQPTALQFLPLLLIKMTIRSMMHLTACFDSF